jgi:hypothetical protein
VDALAWPTHTFQDGEARSAKVSLDKQAGEVSRRSTVPRKRQDARTWVQMTHDTAQVAAMQRQGLYVLQRPAHACGGERKRRGLRQAKYLIRRDQAGELLADAEVIGIARGDDGDRPPAERQDLRECALDGTRPSKARALDQRVRQRKMPLAADNQLGGGDQLACRWRESLNTILADADDA